LAIWISSGPKTVTPTGAVFTAITVKGWKNKGWASYDYAMIVVDRPSPYYMSYGWRKPIPKWTINIAGYPGDLSGRCMWRTHCKIKYRFSKQLGYRCDTFDGMSGSAVYAYWPTTNKRIIYCIHAYGKTTSKNYNKCTRITKSRFKQFKSWIQNYN
jgi:V8-like Glu-specific endopeptidase